MAIRSNDGQGARTNKPRTLRGYFLLKLCQLFNKPAAFKALLITESISKVGYGVCPR